MARLLPLALALSLVAGALLAPGAEAGGKKKKKARTERVVEETYDNPSLGVSGGGVCLPDFGGCIPLTPTLAEKYVKVEITDTLPTQPYATIWTDTDGDSVIDQSIPLCGATDGFVKLVEGATSHLAIWEGPGPTDPCPGGASRGSVKFTYSNLPEPGSS